MTARPMSKLHEVLSSSERAILHDWAAQLAARTARHGLLPEADLRREAAEFLALVTEATGGGATSDTGGHGWAATRDFLKALSRSRAVLGFSPSETATFVLSLKHPVFARLQDALAADASALGEELWAATDLFDQLGLLTTEAFQLERENVIRRQQLEMLELSTPVVKVWDGILALPLIGTLDSVRTHVVMETLLQTIADTESGVAIIDITGVPVVDTLVAQHLLGTVKAARFMGAECLISGIRPQIAQTMVHLGDAFGDVVTKASLADALAYAFRAMGLTVS